MRDHIRQVVGDIKKESRYRQRVTLNGVAGSKIIVDGEEYMNFSSNDYLGLNNHPDILSALQFGAQNYGVSSTASSLVTGYNYAHAALEAEICDWLNRDKALLFTSGFAANVALMHAFGLKDSLLLLDKLSHASIIDGAFTSQAQVKRYLHNDYQQLTSHCLKNTDKKLVVATEAIFSMDGDQTDTGKIAEIAKHYNALSIVDEAHSIGVKGLCGQGCSHKDVDIIMATCGKALATSGAFIACDSELQEYLVNVARHYIYSTAISPAVAWATKKSIEIVRKENWRRDNINSLSFLFKNLLDKKINLLPTSSSIHAINVEKEEAALLASEKLKEKGIWVTAIRPPTVPKGTSRLRVTICANHKEKDIKYLADCINEVLV
ncbi:aminotransferase class I/II-fold pyridoxal phosphate-dependent enzyme [Thalassotalea euphylliae]|uniref:aminotransferase class I/II-fold pyridoxal phosphate-dependent enzyme n=1 Tax=Thalassotalea euphylliae TaxID=1655234 RepID=UPI003631DEFD